MPINEEIVGGLKSALERGDSLRKAMMTFYNAGYQKEQIEEAARFLNQNPSAIPSSTQSGISVPEVPKPANTLTKVVVKPSASSLVPPIPPQIPYSPTNQMVSNYGEKPAQKTPQAQASKYEGKKSDKTIITILVVVLVLLFGILGVIFLFKNEIINFFSSMFG